MTSFSFLSELFL